MMAKGPGAAVLCGKPSAACPLQQRAPQCRDKPPPSAASASSPRKMPKAEIKL